MIDTLRGLLDPLFNLMGATLSTFHGWGAPWWLSIVMLTVVVRTLLFPLTFRQVKSIRKMQELKPDMDEIRAKYKDDSRKQQEEIMKLYAERRVNPLGGCLPLVVQLPIFIVLYYTIKRFDALESFASGGLFWFKDLTIADPYFILPVAYVLTMMASQHWTLKYTAPQQKQLMRFLPIVFGLFLIRFPAGLFVYWISSNIITYYPELRHLRALPDRGRHQRSQRAVRSSLSYRQTAHTSGTLPRAAPPRPRAEHQREQQTFLRQKEQEKEGQEREVRQTGCAFQGNPYACSDREVGSDATRFRAVTLLEASLQTSVSSEGTGTIAQWRKMGA